MIYTTYARAKPFVPAERKLLSFVLVNLAAAPMRRRRRPHRAATGLAVYRGTSSQMTMRYFLKYTGIPINFGLSVVLGFMIGLAIAGQTFYNFTLDNLRHFGVLKALGAGNWLLPRMILLQARSLAPAAMASASAASPYSAFLIAATSASFFGIPW